ncbi:MAG: DUF5719 family protein [Acidimicrobiales bacterium]
MARARRRRSRLTPRRWLPFVALCALVAGAAVVEADTPKLAPEQLDRSLDVATLATVTAADALSTAWYCSGGTASGDGIAELSVVLANDAPEGATAEITFFADDADAAAQPRVVDVPAHGRARLRAGEIVDADWVGALVEVRGGRVAVDREVTGPLGFDASSCSTVAADDWFVASGATVRGAEQYLSIFNPFPDTASVDVTFTTDTGRRAPRELQGLSVPGQSVRVVVVGELVTDRATFAARVRARLGRVVVDRVQTYDGTGDAITTGSGDTEVTTPPPKGLVSVAASPLRADRWVIPSARVGEGIRTQVAIYNPSSEAAEVDVVLHYQEPDRHVELAPVELTVRAGRQAVVDLNSIAGIEPDTDLWIDVQSLEGQPVVAERVSSFGDPSPRVGVATALGSPVVASRWMVTQAGSTQTRTGSVQVANPGPTDAKVRIFVLERNDRRELTTADVTIAAGDRRAIDLEGAGAAATVVVEADAPVVVGSSLVMLDGAGISLEPGFAYPETVEALPPVA